MKAVVAAAAAAPVAVGSEAAPRVWAWPESAAAACGLVSSWRPWSRTRRRHRPPAALLGARS